jgi:hypothetical protein
MQDGSFLPKDRLHKTSYNPDKTFYLERVGDTFVGVGIYKN